MISVNISGEFPTIPNRLPMQDVEKRLLTTIHTNFAVGGRPPWEPLRSGVQETPLVASGRMYRSVRSRSDENSAEAGIENAEPYMMAQQYGAVTHPRVTERSKAFFWAMWFQTGELRWKRMALLPEGTVLNVRIPARPFVMFQDADIDWILKRVENAIVSGPKEKL